VLTTAGDAGLTRAAVEYIVGFDALDVVYLAEEAPAGGYTAWMYGSADALSPGFHLFERQPTFFGLPESDRDAPCEKASVTQALADVTEAFSGHYVYIARAGVSAVELAYADAAYDFLKQRLARYRMELCSLPTVQAVSPDEELSITINREFQTLDPFNLHTPPANEASH
jgi:hypothetical protein